MTHVIYVTHNMLSRLISLIDYVDESTSLMISELNEGTDLNSVPEQKRNLSEVTLSKMNAQIQHVKNELMEIINEQIPFITERKELLRKINTTKKCLVESFKPKEIVIKANYCVDETGKLIKNMPNSSK